MNKIIAIGVPQEELDKALGYFEIAEKYDVLSHYPQALRVVVKELIARITAAKPREGEC